jgi:hypothetical protein
MLDLKVAQFLRAEAGVQQEDHDGAIAQGCSIEHNEEGRFFLVAQMARRLFLLKN